MTALPEDNCLPVQYQYIALHIRTKCFSVHHVHFISLHLIVSKKPSRLSGGGHFHIIRKWRVLSVFSCKKKKEKENSINSEKGIDYDK